MHAQGLQIITNRSMRLSSHHPGKTSSSSGQFLNPNLKLRRRSTSPISHLLQKLHFRGGKLHFPPFVFVRSMCTFSCTFLCHLILMQTSMLIYSNNNRTHSSSRTSERDSSRSSSSCSSHYTAHASSLTNPDSYSLQLPSPRFVSLCRALCCRKGDLCVSSKCRISCFARSSTL